MPLADALQGAIEDVPGIDGGWVAGQFATAPEPVYLVLVGHLDIEAIDGVFDRARVALLPIAAPRALELAYFRPADWAARLATGDRFAASLLAEPRLMLHSIGEEFVHQSPEVA